MNSNTLEQTDSHPRLRLLNTVNNFGIGGTEGQIHQLTQDLNKNLFDIRFACLKKYGPYLGELEQWQLPVQEFPIRTFFNPVTYWQILRLAAFMRTHQIHISHSYNFYANLISVPAARLAGVPLVIASIRDRGVYLSDRQRHVQKWICSLADRVLVNAETIKVWLTEQGVSDHKITVINNGLALSPFDSPALTSDIRLELGLPANARLIIMLARLNPQKGIHEFLEAAALVKKNHPDTHFLIVGESLVSKNGTVERDKDYHNVLYQQAETLGISQCTWFLGHRRDTASLLLQSNISVLPSYSEGLSNSLIESMAAGLPLVATDVGGNKELVKDGVNGFLVPIRDVHSLATAIDSILSDPALAESFGQASKELCRNNYSIKNMTAATEQVYLSLIAHTNHKQQAGSLE